MRWPITITLDQYEMRLALMLGGERYLLSCDLHTDPGKKRGIDPKHGWHTDIEGAAAEIAVAKAYNRYWSGLVNSFSGADVGRDVQVRHTTCEFGHLIIRPDDPPDHYFVLAVGKYPTFKIFKYIRGSEVMGQTERWYRPDDEPAAWWVPQEVLVDA